MPRAARPVLERLLAKCVRNEATGCLVWKGAVSQGHGKYEHLSGYGYIRDDAEHGGKVALVHRVVYRELVGPIPDGFTIDHECVNRVCCEKTHLSAVTHAVNCQLRDERAKLAAEEVPF